MVSDISNSEGKHVNNKKMSLKWLYVDFLVYEMLRFDISRLDMRQGMNDKCGHYIPYILFRIGHNLIGCTWTYNLLMDFNYYIVMETQNQWEVILNDEIPKRK